MTAESERELEKEKAGGLKKLRDRWRRINSDPAIVNAVRKTREALPGDPEIGDSLSTARKRPTDAVARFLAESGEHPSAARELGLSVFQLYQAASEAQGRGRGNVDVAILFTDLVDFSSWALEVGDADALELLRAVDDVAEPAISRRGEIVKHLGDGHMAVFSKAPAAVVAAHEIQGGLQEIEVSGYRPRLRAGVHLGRPRRVGGDYLGVDVNVAARVAAAASGDEVLASEPVVAQLEDEGFSFKRRRFKAKGAPTDLNVYCVERR